MMVRLQLRVVFAGHAICLLLSGELFVKDALLVSVLCLVNEERLVSLFFSCATPVHCIYRQAD